MNLLFRLLRVVIHAFFRKSLNFLQTSVLHFRVLPTDLDLNRHMTNSRYLSVMDLGRTDLIIRTGLGKKVYQQGWSPVLGAATIRWRKALNLFDLYELHTKVLGWDEKWVYIEQQVICKGVVRSVALVKALFVSQKGPVPIQHVVNLMGPDIKSPALPQAVQRWIEMEDDMRSRLKEE